MKTTEKPASTQTGETTPANGKAPAFANGNPVNGESVKVKTAEPVKTEEKLEKAEAIVEPISEAKPALNLDSTLKLVEELHRKKMHRDKLLHTINNLEAFEIDLKADAEDGSDTYQGCTLSITDDKRRQFETKNPVIIQHVSQYVNAMCIAKLAEIEAGITIP